MPPEQVPEQVGPRESMACDVVIVGAGTAGRTAAIRLRQLALDASIVALEKGSTPGARILAGAVMDPRAINEHFPDWMERRAPLNQPVAGDDRLAMTETGARRTPDFLVPNNVDTHGAHVVQLGFLVTWLAEQAEALGVATGEMGIGKDGEPKDGFQIGMELTGRSTIFAEGARGHLGRRLPERLSLADGEDPQSCAIEIKELRESPADKAEPGRVAHAAAWPMDKHAFGGGFLSRPDNNLATPGCVVGLDYSNSWSGPYEQMQRWTTHPAVGVHIEDGKRLGYGARAINNGRPQALPKMAFPGGVYEFIGDPDCADRVRINAQNRVRCKTCDIRDPMQTIVWTPPEGGGRPNYAGM